MEQIWTVYEVTGPVETQRYRTNQDASVVEFWCDDRVPGFARQGWNRTRSQNNTIRARGVLKGILMSGTRVVK